MYWVIAAERTSRFLSLSAALSYAAYLNRSGVDYLITDRDWEPVELSNY